MNQELYPLTFEPVYKDYIWGGQRIASAFNRNTGIDKVAESWEISDRPEGMSVTTNGPLKDLPMSELVNRYSSDLLGTAVNSTVFPLLIKIIDAKKRLSVQVHPNNETANKFGGEPKTEMWYVLDSTPDARVFAGLKPASDADSFRKALLNTTLEEELQSIPVKKGDVIFIPGGRVHAIAEGCLLLEVQQNSNTTYRVYDWGRVGKDGKPRELHVEKAFQVINWEDTDSALTAPGQPFDMGAAVYTELLKCDYFHLRRADLKRTENIQMDGSSFNALFTLSGRMRISANSVSTNAGPGSSCLVPAGVGSYSMEPQEEDTSVIIISI